MSSRMLRFMLVVVWAGVIFALSSVPDLGTGLETWDTPLRKLAHAAEYAILAVLTFRAIGSRALAAVFAAGYACSDEVHQHYVPGRHAAITDVLIDTTGAVLGLLLWSRFQARNRIA